MPLYDANGQDNAIKMSKKIATKGGGRPVITGATIKTASGPVMLGIETPDDSIIKKQTIEKNRLMIDKAKKSSKKDLPMTSVNSLIDKANLIQEMDTHLNELNAEDYPVGTPTALIPRKILSFTNPKFAAFLNKGELIFQKEFRKPITGAQAANKELANLRPIVPMGINPKESYNLTGKSITESMKRAYNLALAEYAKAGFDTSGFPTYEVVAEYLNNKKAKQGQAIKDMPGFTVIE